MSSTKSDSSHFQLNPPKEERIDYYDIFRNNEKYTRICVRLEEAQTWVESSELCDGEDEQKEGSDYAEKANKTLDELYSALTTFGDDLPLLLARRYNILRAKYWALPHHQTTTYYDEYVKQTATLCRSLEQLWGVPFTVSLIHSIIESGYGSQEGAKTHHNYFNFRDENDELIAYENKDASFMHYGEILAQNTAFSQAYTHSATPLDPSIVPNYFSGEKNESPRRFFDKVAAICYEEEAAQYTHRFKQMAHEWKFLNY